MFIFNHYYQPFNFKMRDVLNLKNKFYHFSQKNTSMTIHNTLLMTLLNFNFFFFSVVLYKTNFYNLLFLDPFLFLFLSKKSLSKTL